MDLKEAKTFTSALQSFASKFVLFFFELRLKNVRSFVHFAIFRIIHCSIASAGNIQSVFVLFPTLRLFLHEAIQSINVEDICQLRIKFKISLLIEKK